MKTRDFFFNLPEELIAQHPPAERGTSRLLLLHRKTGSWQHLSVSALPDLLPPGTTIVFNDSRVRKARIYAQAAQSGAKVEFLFLGRHDPGHWLAIVSKAAKQKKGKVFLFPGGCRGTIVECIGNERVLEFDREVDEAFFEEYGHIPLPPYIKRADNTQDSSRYQTVYAQETGSAAAPTAGLHFTGELLAGLQARGCAVVYITLHVGLGTFLPIRTENIEEHRMHEETYAISESAARVLNTALANRSGILAVGTTVVRSLESAYNGHRIAAGTGTTGIYIYPGYEFNVVSGLFTNFHTPGSTLLLLVSAFAGRELTAAAYQEAVREQYRFFSYGDAMLIL